MHPEIGISDGVSMLAIAAILVALWMHEHPRMASILHGSTLDTTAPSLETRGAPPSSRVGPTPHPARGSPDGSRMSCVTPRGMGHAYPTVLGSTEQRYAEFHSLFKSSIYQ